MITNTEIREMVKQIKSIYHLSSEIEFNITDDYIHIYRVPKDDIRRPSHSIARIKLDDIDDMRTVLHADLVSIYLKCKYTLIIDMIANSHELVNNIMW